MGTQPGAQPKVIRFGLYELDLDSRQLRKSGVRIKLQDQPFQILSLLLEHPGAVVTREELQKKLWPGDVFVDFDLSLNSAVKKLRQALSDDSENPRYIETLYRRGYRFIGSVNGALGPNCDHIHAVPAAIAATLPAPARVEPSPQLANSKRFILYAAIALVSIVIGCAALFWRRIVPPPLPHVLGFTQITRDGLFKVGLISDGERLYISELVGDRFAIAQVSAEGGETSVIPTPFANVGIIGILPDNSALVVTAFEGTGKGGATWLLPLPSGAPRRVRDFRIQSLAGSPDRKQAVFSQDRDVYLANSDLSEPVKLATMANPVSDLVFSPDGGRLRFDLFDPGNDELDNARSTYGSSALWEMDRNGRHARPLLTGRSRESRECCGTWTPDGKYFLFQSFQDGRNSIWALPERSGFLGMQPKPVQLTNGPLNFALPVPSSDGKRIFTIGSQPRCELVRADGKSGFTQYMDGRSVSDLAFSPDGNWVAYVTVPEGQLWRSRVNGGDRLQLSPDAMQAGLPRWSPDGKQIVFMGTNLKTDWRLADWRLYLMTSDGTSLRELIPGADSGYDPGWSSDGNSIVFTPSPGGGTPTAEGPGLEIYDLENHKISLLPGTKHLFSPRWSPDGRYIAAITNDSTKLMLFDRTTQQWRELVNLTVGYPTWSHDSRYIYFDTALNEDAAFYRVRIADHKLERLFSLKGMRRYWGPFGPWTGLTPDDSPLLDRDISSQEIYALAWDAR